MTPFHYKHTCGTFSEMVRKCSASNMKKLEGSNESLHVFTEKGFFWYSCVEDNADSCIFLKVQNVCTVRSGKSICCESCLTNIT